MSILTKLIFAFMLFAYLPIINATVITTNGNSNSNFNYEYMLDGLLEETKVSGDSLIFAPLIYSVLRGNSNDRDLNISAFVAKVDPLPEHTIAPISMDEKKDNLFEGVKVDAPDTGDLFETNLPIVTSVPLPQTIWMFGAGLFGLLSVAKRKNIM